MNNRYASKYKPQYAMDYNSKDQISEIQANGKTALHIYDVRDAAKIFPLLDKYPYGADRSSYNRYVLKLDEKEELPFKIIDTGHITGADDNVNVWIASAVDFDYADTLLTILNANPISSKVK